MVANVKKDLKKLSKSSKAKILQRFFKTGKGQYSEGDKFIGVVVPDIRKVSKQYSDLPLKQVSELLHSKIHEERLCALLILVEQYKKGDSKKQKQIFGLYLKNYKYINNWDLVDLTAPRIVGAYLADKPKNILYKLAKSKNLWQRRIAILATFQFIYYCQSKETIKIANILLHDKHDLIQKAVGWMLREVGKRCDEQILLNFLDKNYKTMPRTMLRYAIERLLEKKRQHYLGKKNSTSRLLKFFALLFFLGLPFSAWASGELMFSPNDYNLDHTVKPGEIWDIKNLLLVNIGQRDLDVELAAYFSDDQKDVLKIDVKNVSLEMGKAKNIDLAFTMPLDMKAGYYKGQIVAVTAIDQLTKSEASEVRMNLNFVVEKNNYFQALVERLKSQAKFNGLTLYLSAILFVLWFGFFVFITLRKIKRRIKEKT
ncbi:MAG: DNA alkylation repair protein [Patescibacteria group bacterium]|jgi:3-methyladenine DNA glycosylase AlkD